jgi:predicted TIM-barrel fold metal-dependent hydrolase
MHLHDYTEQTYFIAPAPDGVMSPQSLSEYRQQVDAMLRKYNVVKAVISTIGGENRVDVEGILIPGYHTNGAPTDTITFKKLIETGKLKVFGEIGAVYDGFTLSDPQFEPYLDICERFDIPVAVHTGGGPTDITYRCCPDFRIKLGDPFSIEDVLAKHPKLRIYIMHAGEVFYEHALRLMLQYSQLYSDLGVILWVHEQPMDYAENFLKKAKQYGLLDRVMFGSDQMVWPHAIEKSILQLDSYDFLTKEDKRNIFYYNAAKFLKLDENQN